MGETFWQKITRRKPYYTVMVETKLKRALGVLDLTALGVGTTLGLGAYVLAGTVAYDLAGPSVVISFAIAAIVSVFSALCYAEFAAYYPKAGSVYNYTYVSMGEFLAFIIGWDMVLEYVIGTSSVARGMSAYFDALTNYEMSNYLNETFPMSVTYFAQYPDFFSFTAIIILMIILLLGVKESTTVNNVFTIVNVCVIILTIICGAMNANFDNWTIDPKKVTTHRNIGYGGFFPFGFKGMMSGAARCFYGFVGFDTIATTGEEAKNPSRDVPVSILISMTIITVAYLGISIVLTLMVPYYLQNPAAPFPHAFDQVGWNVIKWIVTIGACFALTTALFGALFPMPRIFYGMAVDGVIYKCMRYVSNRTKVPVITTIVTGLLAAVTALTFDLDHLIDMMSIGTLLAYTLVAMCVICLRYGNSLEQIHPPFTTFGRQIFNTTKTKEPDINSTKIVGICVFIYFGICVIFSVLMFYIGIPKPENLEMFMCVFLFILVMVILLHIITLQPQLEKKITFEVPYVPFIPAISILCNTYLMAHLDWMTWVRFLVWLFLGLIIYFTYGIWHSEERLKPKAETESIETNRIYEMSS